MCYFSAEIPVVSAWQHATTHGIGVVSSEWRTMGFAREVTPDEAALGFEIAEHVAFGRIVFARIGNGIRAIKMIGDDGAVRYEICDDHGMVLYRPSTSLFGLRRRFDLGDRRAG